MVTIKSRIEALEQQAEINEQVIFFEVHPDEPAQGWFFYRDGGRMDILHQGDESNAALLARAADACRAANCPLVLFEIDPDRINHYGLIVPHVMEPGAWEKSTREQQAELCRRWDALGALVDEVSA